MTAEEAGAYKPDPLPYRMALDRLDLDPAEVLFVAGSAHDVGGAARVGMDVYWANRGGVAAPTDGTALRQEPDFRGSARDDGYRSLIGRAAITQRDDGDLVDPRTDADWLDWVAARDIRNWCDDDLLLDWLSEFGEQHGFRRDDQLPGYDRVFDLARYLMDQGRALRAGRARRPSAALAGDADRDTTRRSAFPRRGRGDVGRDEERRPGHRVRGASRPRAAHLRRRRPSRAIRRARRALPRRVHRRPARAAGRRHAARPALPRRRHQVLDAPPAEGRRPRRGLARRDGAEPGSTTRRSAGSRDSHRRPHTSRAARGDRAPRAAIVAGKRWRASRARRSCDRATRISARVVARGDRVGQATAHRGRRVARPPDPVGARALAEHEGRQRLPVAHGEGGDRRQARRAHDPAPRQRRTCARRRTPSE